MHLNWTGRSKLSLFTDAVILCVEIPKEFPLKPIRNNKQIWQNNRMQNLFLLLNIVLGKTALKLYILLFCLTYPIHFSS